jgi:hypothetical protein
MSFDRFPSDRFRWFRPLRGLELVPGGLELVPEPPTITAPDGFLCRGLRSILVLCLFLARKLVPASVPQPVPQLVPASIGSGTTYATRNGLPFPPGWTSLRESMSSLIA